MRLLHFGCRLCEVLSPTLKSMATRPRDSLNLMARFWLAGGAHAGPWLDKCLRRTGRPLIFSTLLNAAVFAALVACFKLLEEAIVGHRHGKTLAESIAEFGGSGHGTLWLIAIFLVRLIPFCASANRALF
jgi:hypothetical protein